MKRLLFLPGDGIGPEVLAETRRVLEWFSTRRQFSFSAEEDLIGGCAYDALGTPAPDAVIAKAKAAGCACARTWSCSPTCARHSASTH